MEEVIAADKLETGMFVVSLDRPWLGTPFLLQGFLIEDAAQIAQLRQYCRSVAIDRTRSLGAHYAAPPRTPPPARRVASRLEPSFSVQQAEDDFGSVLRRLREAPPKRVPGRKPPTISSADRQSRLEEELLYSAPLVDDIKQKLQSIKSALDGNIGGEIREVVGLVTEMAEAVERNPDALIWLARLRSTDEYSYDHAVDVSVHLMVLARFLGMAKPIVEMLGQVGLMQDVGKVRLPEGLLGKPTEPSAEELALLQSHVASSLEILSRQPDFSVEVLTIVGSHHERHDGSGYPRRIQGEKISLYAELAGLIDTYCAMTRQRAYRAAVSHQQALESLIALRDGKFRAPVVDQLIQCLGLYPIGSLVELNSGEVAVVVQQNAIRRLKPRVMILLNADKSVEARPRTLDLLMDPATPTGTPYRIVRSLPLNAYGINPADFYLG